VRTACYAICMWFVIKVLIGFAVFWWWFLVGSSDHCPRCGTSLIDSYDLGPLVRTTRRRSCACGWHE